MTTLRAFQSEIDQIHIREVNKQRIEAAAQAAKVKEATSKPKATASTVESPQPGTKTEENGQLTQAIPRLDEKHTEGDEQRLRDEEEAAIINLLLSGATDQHERARDMIASLLTRNRGEYVFRLGERPTNEHLFALASKVPETQFTGVARTTNELARLRKEMSVAAEEVGGKLCVLFETLDDHPRAVYLIRLPPPNVSLTPEVRVAVVGNVDAGKSSFLGVLTRGSLDDGRGSARVALFRHKHEIETGRTSSVGMEILGFAPSGEPIIPNTRPADAGGHREKRSWESISLQAAKIVSFSDLAGHERYLKTTLYGLTSGAPSCVILIVGANAGLIGMSKEHLAIALALNVPVVVCITKIDMTPPNIAAETMKQVIKILKSPGCRKVPVLVRSIETAVEISQAYAKDRLCPIFQISNVTGEGLDFVRTFLNLLPSSEGDTEKYPVDQPLEYSITETWSVPYVGTVVNGILNSGTVKTGDALMLGPDYNGNYLQTSVKSMHRKQAVVTTAEAGQSVSMALKRVRRADVRKGMVIVHKSEMPPKASRQFEGQVLILYHNTTLQKNYQAMLHCGAIRQTVRIINIDHPQGLLRTGDRATVQFEFISHPELIKEGMKLLFREGKTKGLGVITRLL
jgi:GTPase